jgi:hypothetical protein
MFLGFGLLAQFSFLIPRRGRRWRLSKWFLAVLALSVGGAVSASAYQLLCVSFLKKRGAPHCVTDLRQSFVQLAIDEIKLLSTEFAVGQHEREVIAFHTLASFRRLTSWRFRSEMRA